MNTESKSDSPPVGGDSCVICLESISERAVVAPCNHCSFDFICIVSWLEEQTKCPLCKEEVDRVEYDWRSPTDFKTYYLQTEAKATRSTSEPPPNCAISSSGSSGGSSNASSSNSTNTRNRYLRRRQQHNPEQVEIDVTLAKRRFVYRQRLYSLHVGSNRISGFRTLTPELMASSAVLQSRARKWIRRELRVFDFLDPNVAADVTSARGVVGQSSSSSSFAPPGRNGRRRSVNDVEFLLEYIVSMLKVLDVKGGKAEDLLQEHLGRDYARLFLHELNSWLRSPFEHLAEWDAFVQYPKQSC